MDAGRLESLLARWWESGQSVTLQTTTGKRVTGQVEGIVEEVVVLVSEGVFHFVDLEAILYAELAESE